MLTWIPFAKAALVLDDEGTTVYTLKAVTLQMDYLGLLLAALALGLGTLVVVYSGPYMAADEGQEKYYACCGDDRRR